MQEPPSLFPSYVVYELTPEARHVIETAGGQVRPQPEYGGYVVCHPPPEATSATEDGWLLMELPTGVLWYEEETGRLEGERAAAPVASGVGTGARSRTRLVALDAVDGFPRSERGISISGSWCVGLWMLGLLLNGLVLTRGWQPPPSWLAWGLDELVAGALLGGWLLLTWWRQQRLWLIGALLLVGALWLASWL